MHPIVNAKLPEVRSLCERYHVRKLELFGSAATDRFDPGRSDLDFLVELDPAEPVAHSDRYFGLLFALEDLFARHVDLVETRAIRNPYFLQVIERSRTTLYAA